MRGQVLAVLERAVADSGTTRWPGGPGVFAAGDVAGHPAVGVGAVAGGDQAPLLRRRRACGRRPRRGPPLACSTCRSGRVRPAGGAGLRRLAEPGRDSRGMASSQAGAGSGSRYGSGAGRRRRTRSGCPVSTWIDGGAIDQGVVARGCGSPCACTSRRRPSSPHVSQRPQMSPVGHSSSAVRQRGTRMVPAAPVRRQPSPGRLVAVAGADPAPGCRAASGRPGRRR